MLSYHSLAGCYDRLTRDVDYESVVDFYYTVMEREGICPRTAADLACGTGSVTRLLAQRGLRVYGVDLSEEMLTQAQMKTEGLVPAPTFLHQDLKDLSLSRGVDLAVCALDSLDYITDPSDCEMAIRRIFRALNPGGIFLFDVNTPAKLRAMDGQIFLDEDDDVFCVWRGEFDEESNICTYGMDLFRRNGSLWERSCEEHREYAYSEEQLTAFLKKAGFTRIRWYEDPVQFGQRIHCSARKGVLK